MLLWADGVQSHLENRRVLEGEGTEGCTQGLVYKT